METRNKVVDFASYRFARDLRLTEARDAAAREARLPPASRRADLLSDAATAHRERMLRHLAQLPRR